MALNRDTIVAIVLLLICGGLMAASYEIREPNYGQLSPAAWPRAIIVALTILCGIFLIQSLMKGPDSPNPNAPKGLSAWFAHWRNVIWVFILFLAYLFAIPWIGMLLGGMLFVFALLSALGGFQRVLLHIAIAVVSVGGMWTLFTFGLRVILPRGELTGF